MSRKLLHDIAWAHSGDKGDCINLGVVARRPEDYDLLLRVVTAERVREHFSDICLATCYATNCPISTPSIWC